MNTKEIVEQTGVTMDNVYACYERDIERFVKLVRADEREACAKIALKYEPIERQPYVTYAADEIRARGDK
jgi:hypothetical protein